MICDEPPCASRYEPVQTAGPHLTSLPDEHAEHSKHYKTETRARQHKDDLEDKSSGAEIQRVGGGQSEAPGDSEEYESECYAHPSLEPRVGSIFVDVASDAGCEKESDGGDEVDYSRDEDQSIPV